jgi:predicted GH43/DUF377 family glycosyl hydrolase
LALGETEVESVLDELIDRFSDRHEDLIDVFESHAERVADFVSVQISSSRRQLLGAVFTHEYSLEGAAVCNPSLVAHPDQRGVEAGGVRVIMSYRAIGEGHYSSICFRTGEIDAHGALHLHEPHPFPVVASITQGLLNRDVVHAKLRDLNLDGETAATVLNALAHQFSIEELDAAITRLSSQSDTRLNVLETATLLRSMTQSFYVASFDEGTDISRRVLWPSSPDERRGMEDARFVELSEDDVTRYAASYTAFDGHNVSQQLLQTNDFLTFESSPLAGLGANNKGLAIFPRCVDGEFVALSRHDRESNAIAFSENLHRWDEVSTIQMPGESWEMLQLGNCGSPTEFEEGWLVITHGVGPMRTYGIGALLLDLHDPTKVLAQLPRPLLVPSSDEQNGYVPNVVYSCGSLLHDGALYLPYGAADQSMGYVTVQVSELLAAMQQYA